MSDAECFDEIMSRLKAIDSSALDELESLRNDEFYGDNGTACGNIWRSENPEWQTAIQRQLDRINGVSAQAPETEAASASFPTSEPAPKPEPDPEETITDEPLAQSESTEVPAPTPAPALEEPAPTPAPAPEEPAPTPAPAPAPAPEEPAPAPAPVPAPIPDNVDKLDVEMPWFSGERTCIFRLVALGLWYMYAGEILDYVVDTEEQGLLGDDTATSWTAENDSQRALAQPSLYILVVLERWLRYYAALFDGTAESERSALIETAQRDLTRVKALLQHYRKTGALITQSEDANPMSRLAPEQSTAMMRCGDLISADRERYVLKVLAATLLNDQMDIDTGSLVSKFIIARGRSTPQALEHYVRLVAPRTASTRKALSAKPYWQLTQVSIPNLIDLEFQSGDSASPKAQNLANKVGSQLEFVSSPNATAYLTTSLSFALPYLPPNLAVRAAWFRIVRASFLNECPASDEGAAASLVMASRGAVADTAEALRQNKAELESALAELASLRQKIDDQQAPIREAIASGTADDLESANSALQGLSETAESVDLTASKLSAELDVTTRQLNAVTRGGSAEEPQSSEVYEMKFGEAAPMAPKTLPSGLATTMATATSIPLESVGPPLQPQPAKASPSISIPEWAVAEPTEPLPSALVASMATASPISLQSGTTQSQSQSLSQPIPEVFQPPRPPPLPTGTIARAAPSATTALQSQIDERLAQWRDIEALAGPNESSSRVPLQPEYASGLSPEIVRGAITPTYVRPAGQLATPAPEATATQPQSQPTLQTQELERQRHEEDLEQRRQARRTREAAEAKSSQPQAPPQPELTSEEQIREAFRVYDQTFEQRKQYRREGGSLGLIMYAENEWRLHEPKNPKWQKITFTEALALLGTGTVTLLANLPSL